MVRKVNSLNTASCFLPHVLLGKTTLLLNFCLFPPSHLHFGPFFFFLNSWKKIPPHRPVFKKKQK